jgi:predicted nucleotidyltransferase component of viral defense system
VQAQERDNIQHLLLFSLYNKSQELVFKGGTALRITYQGNRYPEDLDGALEKAKAGWNRDLRPLLSQFISWKDVISRTGPILDGVVQ